MRGGITEGMIGELKLGGERLNEENDRCNLPWSTLKIIVESNDNFNFELISRT